MVPSVICALESRRPRYLCNIGKRILDNIYKIHQKFFYRYFVGEKAYRQVSSLCELCRRKLRHRIISSVVLCRRKPRDMRISSVVDCRRIVGR